MATEFRQPALPAVIELDLVESVDRRGAPVLVGHLNGTKVTAFVLRRDRDPTTGEERKVWRMVVQRVASP